MVVLGMDTATQILAVGLGNQGNLLGSAAAAIPRGHSRLLQPTLQSVLQIAGLAARDVNRIAVGVGPGSYTGVRLGVATAKAMATALGCELALLSTLDVMAQAAAPITMHKSLLVVPLLYARRQRAFGSGRLKQGIHWKTVLPQRVLQVSVWMAELSAWKQQNPDTDVLVVHDFVARYEVLHWLESPLVTGQARLADVAGGMGGALIALGEGPNATVLQGSAIHAAVPDYALQVEAEVKLAERRSGEHGHG